MKAFRILFMICSMIFLLSACGSAEESNSKNTTTAAKETTNEEKGIFPEENIEIIVPYGAGGATDQIARVLQKAAQKHMPNQSLVVVNKPGGAGTIGVTEVFNADPDGYKIALVAGGPLSVQPHYGNTEFSHDSFQPIIRVSSSPILLAVRNDAPWKSLEEFISYIKENPGEFTYSSTGTGNPAHIGMEKMNNALDTTTVNIPAESSGEAFTAMLGGHVDGTVGSAQQFKGQGSSNDIRILANLGSIKNDEFKEVPTLKEVGVDAVTDIYFGLVAPKGISGERLDKLHEIFSAALEDSELIEQFNNVGLSTDYAGPDEFQEVISESYHTEGDILKKIGLIK